MIAEKEIHFGKERLILTNQRAVFCENSKSLILSDLHLGKTAHFRKHGIAIPGSVSTRDLNRLTKLIVHYRPKMVIVAGDFFHASENGDLEIFKTWKKNFDDLNFILVKGNHDILPLATYRELGIEQHPISFPLNGLHIVHHPVKQSGNFNICGHIHPGVLLKGTGKQRLRLPCYILTENQLILPAFSEFTGLDASHSTNATIYAFTKDAILEV